MCVRFAGISQESPSLQILRPDVLGLFEPLSPYFVQGEFANPLDCQMQFRFTGPKLKQNLSRWISNSWNWQIQFCPLGKTENPIGIFASGCWRRGKRSTRRGCCASKAARGSDDADYEISEKSRNHRLQGSALVVEYRMWQNEPATPPPAWSAETPTAHPACGA